jgi:hypothetical protein
LRHRENTEKTHQLRICEKGGGKDTETEGGKDTETEGGKLICPSPDDYSKFERNGPILMRGAGLPVTAIGP